MQDAATALMDLRSTISFSAAEQNPCGRRVRMV